MNLFGAASTDSVELSEVRPGSRHERQFEHLAGPPEIGRGPTRRRGDGAPKRVLAAFTAVALGVGLTLTATAISAQAAPVGQGFTVTASDLAFILKQIKIAEAHVANTTPATGPCGALVGTGPNQIPDALMSFGLRTVDGSCNNLVAGQETFGAADQVFPRLTQPVFRDAEPVPAGFGAAGPSSYKQTSRQRLRHPAARDQQPDRRPDLDQPRRRRGRRVPGPDPGQPGAAPLHDRS